VRVTQRNVRQVARAVAAESPNVKVAISGSEILLSGPPDEVDHAKQLIAQLDVPQMGTQYTEVYRLKYIDAASVADLFQGERAAGTKMSPDLSTHRPST
jgi:type II secretory pathway component GspD/PulD (secretin)